MVPDLKPDRCVDQGTFLDDGRRVPSTTIEYDRPNGYTRNARAIGRHGGEESRATAMEVDWWRGLLHPGT